MTENERNAEAGVPQQGPAVSADVPAGGRLFLGWVLVVTGLVLLIVGWFGVSGEPDVARQLAYLVSGGIGGLFAGIVGVGLLISNDVRIDRERLGRLEATMLEMRDTLAAQAEILGGGVPDGSAEGDRNGDGARAARSRPSSRART